MTEVAIIGCGVVGAAIAYELSLVEGLNITLFDRAAPASGSTGAALGVLMGAISQKTKGRAWRLRQQSMQRYETLIPELEALTGKSIPFNRQGIIMLLFEGENWQKWEKLLEIRRSQGWQLEIWDEKQLLKKCPQIENNQIIGAVYSPQDRQVNPTILTQSLVAGAAIKGVNCQFGVEVQNFTTIALDGSNIRRCCEIKTTTGSFTTDWAIFAAGNDSALLSATLAEPIALRPVLGQALRLKLNHSLGHPNFQPVITGEDVQIIPLGEGEYWVGATVEFPSATGEVEAKAELLEKVLQEAIYFCPSLKDATVIETWSGKRPRPEGEPAPLIKKLSGYSNVLLATGHYRNGVLLAPATAKEIREMIGS